MGGIAMLENGGEPNVKGILSTLKDDEGIKEIDILMDNFGMSFEEAKEYLESIADNKATGVDNAGGPKAMYNLMNKLDPESSKGRGIMS